MLGVKAAASNSSGKRWFVKFQHVQSRKTSILRSLVLSLQRQQRGECVLSIGIFPLQTPLQTPLQELYIPLFRCERYDQPHLGDKNFDEYSYERWAWQELGDMPARLLSRSLQRNRSVPAAGGGHEASDGALKGKAAMDYLMLAAAIVTRELKEESYDSVEGFENVSSTPPTPRVVAIPRGLIEFQFIQAALLSGSSSARASVTVLYTTQKEKAVVRQLHWSDLSFVNEPRGVCFIVRVEEHFCRDLVREWRLRHARIMTADADADDSAKAQAVAAVAAHGDVFKPCTVPQLHLPSGCFHPTVELKQLEHSDVRPPSCGCSPRAHAAFELSAFRRCVCFPCKASARNPSTAARLLCSNALPSTLTPILSYSRPAIPCAGTARGSTARGSSLTCQSCPLPPLLASKSAAAPRPRAASR
jgi:hypothetical protein